MSSHFISITGISNSFRNIVGKGLVWDLAGNYGGQIFSFAISIVLARLLTPEEFGLVAISLVFITMLQVFTDMGFSSALVQNKHNSSLILSSIFYLNILLGVLLTLVLYVSAPMISDFYENAVISDLIRLLSITFFLSSFNIVQSSILTKKLDFKQLTIRDIASQVIAGVAAIIFAILGYGIYALIFQQIISVLLKTILLWRITEWYPKLEFSFVEVKSLSKFSLYLFFSQLANQFVKQSDTLVVGKLFNPSTLGFFSRAKGLNTLIAQNSARSISKVFFPALSSIRDDDEKFKRVYIRVISIVSAFSIFFTGVFFLSGELVIIGLFGDNWAPSVSIFQIIVLKGFTFPVSAMIVNAFLAKGKAKENFRYGNIRKLLSLSPLVVAFAIGFEAYLYATVIVSYIGWTLNNYFATRSLRIAMRSQILAVMPNLLAATLIVISAMLIIPKGSEFHLIIIKVLYFIILYFFWLYQSKSAIVGEVNYYWLKLRSRTKLF